MSEEHGSAADKIKERMIKAHPWVSWSALLGVLMLISGLLSGYVNISSAAINAHLGRQDDAISKIVVSDQTQNAKISTLKNRQDEIYRTNDRQDHDIESLQAREDDHYKTLDGKLDKILQIMAQRNGRGG